MILFCWAGLAGYSQDSVYVTNIRTPQLFTYGNQLGYPIIRLNSGDQLELHFDDLDADVKNYSYSYVLCNEDWTPAVISEFDYIRGYSQVRISDYRLSSVALTKYTHYQALLPDRNCMPIHSGNYIVKVFLNGDTSQLVFTRRMLVAGKGASIGAQILQPFSPETSRTHQKIQMTVNTGTLAISDMFQQIHVWILQNNRWDNAIHDVKPNFYSGNTLQYNSDDAFVFPGGNEWRWVDIQGTFHFLSDRLLKGNYGPASTELIVRPDPDRSRLPYYYYADYDGMYYIQTTESINPVWQTDYATLQFSFVPADHNPYPDRDVYIFGELTGYGLHDAFKMSFNPDRGAYQTSLLLKQGFYNYSYVTIDRHDPKRMASFEFTEGNHLETENNYMILVYFRPLGGRADELVGFTSMNSKMTQ